MIFSENTENFYKKMENPVLLFFSFLLSPIFSTFCLWSFFHSAIMLRKIRKVELWKYFASRSQNGRIPIIRTENDQNEILRIMEKYGISDVWIKIDNGLDN